MYAFTDPLQLFAMAIDRIFAASYYILSIYKKETYIGEVIYTTGKRNTVQFYSRM